MRDFSFQGEIPASKSLMNRALLVQSYFPDLKIKGDSDCDDVHHMKSAIQSLRSKDSKIPCGEAGTVLRFMTLRASREIGTFHLLGSSRLMQRPQQELAEILAQLQVSCEILPNEIKVKGQGWLKPTQTLKVQRQKSSQFASSLLLNSWNLPFDLEFEMPGGISEGYWQMSLEMARSLGMIVEKSADTWQIPAHQKINKSEIQLEPDYSSAFAIAAAAALCGKAVITNATLQSSQPDFRFIKILQEMDAQVEHNSHFLKIQKASRLRAIQVNLESSPDLFPVLAVLCAFTDGISILSGAPHLVHKESNRIEKTAELLKKAGFSVQVQKDGMRIEGKSHPAIPSAFQFDPDEDHRMAMAAGILKLKGFEIQIHDPQVVSKSYPQFWQVLGVQP